MTTNEKSFAIPDDVAKLQQAAKDYIETEIVPLEPYMDYDAIEAPESEKDRLEKKVQELGLWNMGVPVEYGGTDLSAFTHAVVQEELVQHRGGLYNTCYDTLGHSAMGALYAGNDYQKERYLYPTLRGELESFLGITEPSGGADPARAIRTYATKDGDDWILNGSKMFQGGGPWANYGLVFARTDPQSRRGISCFIVEQNWPGVTCNPIPVLRAHYAGQFFFDNVRVPAKNLLGEVDNGWKLLAFDILAKGRVGYSVNNLGIAVGAHKFAVESCKTRETFGAPLSTRQAVQWMLVDSEIELKSTRWLCWEGAWQIDNDEDFRHSASLAKVYSSEVLQRTLDRSIQIIGAHALERDPAGLPVERWYRESRIRRIGEGPSEVQRIVVARNMLSVGSGINPPTS
jgi:acyl-CoA dehydrogenase